MVYGYWTVVAKALLKTLVQEEEEEEKDSNYQNVQKPWYMMNIMYFVGDIFSS